MNTKDSNTLRREANNLLNWGSVTAELEEEKDNWDHKVAQDEIKKQDLSDSQSLKSDQAKDQDDQTNLSRRVSTSKNLEIVHEDETEYEELEHSNV
eukprot:CAMPEP_0116985430 /NCGR_PEP_ID=MMETSP0467-20121206/62244_1 /TAXON_ID=283647 /ORGANISM="Mesodinium pulex, Strain SPMC105" /LENGTH=95 /DNA_ID=CAMNT_0004680733 /DNA_START=1722 /DNA_END=2009 /DNA_ORIENTATION=+